MSIDKVTSQALAPNAVQISNIPDNEITAAKLHTTAIQDKLGYTPVSSSYVSDQLTIISDAINDLDTSKQDLIGYTPVSPTQLQDELSNISTQLEGSLSSPGMVVYFAASTAPVGWLKANGAAVSRTTYANLFNYIGTLYGSGDGSTTFNLPDFRGEFLRAWDDSRGVDSGRSFGSAQSHMFGSHQHFLVRNAYTNQYSQYGISLYTNNYIAGAGSGGYETYYLNGHTSEANVALSSPTGGAETRPRNIALLACIKY